MCNDSDENACASKEINGFVFIHGASPKVDLYMARVRFIKLFLCTIDPNFFNA